MLGNADGASGDAVFYKALKQGTYYAYFQAQFKAFGIPCTQLNYDNLYGKADSSVHKQALELLQDGWYLIACMGKGNWTSSGHYVLVWKVEGDVVYINDPASTKKSRTEGSYPLFKQQVKYYWTIERPEDIRDDEEELDMTVEEALGFFDNLPKIRNKIQALYDVGLEYIKLGQPSTTLSGGEAQRVKLATELSRPSTGRTLYVLDEPTTGLHTADVHKLLQVLQRLVDGGNTVVVIEHNLDVIKCADHIIDLGPEGGDKGGTIVCTGTPEEVAACPESYTGQYLKRVLEHS